MRGILAFALSLALTLSLAACTPTQEDVPEDIGAPAVTEPADTSALEPTDPPERVEQEPLEPAAPTADTEPTEIPAQETPTAEVPAPEPVQQPTQQQETPVMPDDGGGNPGSGEGGPSGQTPGNHDSSDLSGVSSSVSQGDTAGVQSGSSQTTPPTDSGSQGKQDSNPSSDNLSGWDSPEQKAEWEQKMEDAGIEIIGGGGLRQPNP